jgi:GMP synthase-like glutamine amidotransferase
MKPIAIFRHSPGEGPGYFATFLDRHSLPWRCSRSMRAIFRPPSPDEFSGLCFMGGPMSVNDDLPWIPATLALIRAADAAGIPVIGHCLGGQLMAKALGGSVGRNPVKEIGWGGSIPSSRQPTGSAHRTLRGLSLARRNLHHSAGRDSHPRQRTAPTRPSCAVRTWPCNAMSR